MGLAPMHPLIGAAEWTEIDLDLPDEPEGQPGLASAGVAAHKAGGADFG